MLHGRWTERNRIALEELIGRDRIKSPIAVFDWDNTCIRGDVADAVFHRQCDELAFRFEAPGFWDWVTEASPEEQVSAAYQRYRADPNQENGLRLRMSFERTRNALHQGKDDTSAWAWDTGAFVGWKEEQVRAYTLKVINRELTRPPAG